MANESATGGDRRSFNVHGWKHQQLEDRLHDAKKGDAEPESTTTRRRQRRGDTIVTARCPTTTKRFVFEDHQAIRCLATKALTFPFCSLSTQPIFFSSASIFSPFLSTRKNSAVYPGFKMHLYAGDDMLSCEQ